MNNHSSKQLDTTGFTKSANSDFNNLESIEAVYTDESIELIDMPDIQHAVDAEPMNTDLVQLSVDHTAANDEVLEAEVYALSGARRSKLDKALERRASKSRLTDRRQSARLDANGEPQLDRRAENRLVNIESLRPAN